MTNIDRAKVEAIRNSPMELARSYRSSGEALQLYRQATTEYGSMENFLDDTYKAERGELTGVQHVMRSMGIVQRSVPGRNIYSTPISRLFEQESVLVDYVLFPSMVYGAIQADNLYEDYLDQIVAIRQEYVGGGMIVPYFNDKVGDRRMYRVPQGSRIPVTQMAISTKPIIGYKYGTALESTYEALRNSPFTVEGLILEAQRIQQQNRLDRQMDIFTMLVNGDGNANPAPSYNLTTLDPATTAGNFTYVAYLQMMAKSKAISGSYSWNVVMGNMNTLTKLSQPTMPGGFVPFIMSGNVQPADGQQPAFVRPAGVYGPIQMIPLYDAPDNVAVFADSRFAAIEGVNAGSEMQERERSIMDQTERLAITGTYAEGKLRQGASAVLVLNA